MPSGAIKQALKNCPAPASAQAMRSELFARGLYRMKAGQRNRQCDLRGIAVAEGMIAPCRSLPAPPRFGKHTCEARWKVGTEGMRAVLIETEL